MRCPTVSRAVGVVPAPLITGLISSRLKPNNLFVARDIGVLIIASVNKLAAVPKPDWASTEVFCSLEDNEPVRISETTSACGKPAQ